MHSRKCSEQNMDPAKLTASLTELVKKFVISFCEVNVGYHDRLDVFGSIHIRSDDSDVVAFVLNEHCYKKSSADVSDDDYESESAIAKKSKATADASDIGFAIKTELQTDYEGYSGSIKQEGNSVSDAIDVHSDGEENAETSQSLGEDAEQNFIDHLLDINKTDAMETNRVSNPLKRGRSRRAASNPRHFNQDEGHGYYQEPQDFKSESEFQNPETFAEVDYGLRMDGGDEYKFGSKFNDDSRTVSRKARKRGSAIPNPLATSSLQGSFFQFESTYTCTACGCRFKSMDGLKCHVNSKHLQQKLYSCQFCSQTFLTRQASYSHRVKFHNISRPKAASSQLDSDFS